MKANSTLAVAPVRFAGVEAATHRIVSGVHWLKIAYAERRRRERSRRERLTLEERALRNHGMDR